MWACACVCVMEQEQLPVRQKVWLEGRSQSPHTSNTQPSEKFNSLQTQHHRRIYTNVRNSARTGQHAGGDVHTNADKARTSSQGALAERHRGLTWPQGNGDANLQTQPITSLRRCDALKNRRWRKDQWQSCVTSPACRLNSCDVVTCKRTISLQCLAGGLISLVPERRDKE